MRKTRLVTVILFGLCAVIWTVRSVGDFLDYRNQSSVHSLGWVIVNGLCAVLWIVCFLIYLKRYLSDKEK